MKTWMKVLLIALAVFFCVGAFHGNYNCSGQLGSAVSSTAGFACSVIKATCYGMQTVMNGVFGVFS